jgi:hypothetical protein
VHHVTIGPPAPQLVYVDSACLPETPSVERHTEKGPPRRAARSLGRKRPRRAQHSNANRCVALHNLSPPHVRASAKGQRCCPFFICECEVRRHGPSAIAKGPGHQPHERLSCSNGNGGRKLTFFWRTGSLDQGSFSRPITAWLMGPLEARCSHPPGLLLRCRCPDTLLRHQPALP